MIIHRAILALIFSVPIISSTVTENVTHRCNRSCGSGSGLRRVQYPFGFSEGCEIRLTCSGDGVIGLGGFHVQNVTPDNIVINLPESCGRSIDSIRPLFAKNYAPTIQNGLLLHGCSSNLTHCVIPDPLIRNRFRSSSNCGGLNCFSGEDRGGVELLRFDEVNNTGCRRLFSSIAAQPENSSVSLKFQTLLLAWWLEGRCRCSSNETCRKVKIAGGGSGFQCRCKDGLRRRDNADVFGCRRADVSGRGKNNEPGIIVGGVSGGVCIMVIVSLSIFSVRRRSSHRKNQRSARRLLSVAAGNSSIPFFPHREIERATNSFSEEQRLGTGAYGTVYAGKFDNGEWVAVKKIKHRDAEGIEAVMNEVKLLSCVSHPNLVRLLGCCIDEAEPVLVYEFMPNGTLCEHLQRQRGGGGLPWTTRITIAAETAHAIAHLHSAMNPPIYHRDIKSSNILLDYNLNSKVADFGLSRLGMAGLSHVSTTPQGTPGYLDPQYHQSFHLSDKSDVYSFGVVLVEIITAMKVVDFCRPQAEVNLAALAVDRIGRGCVDEIVDPFLELHRDAWTLSSVHRVGELAFRCLAFHRDMRPSMTEVAEELEQIRAGGCDPPPEENVWTTSSLASSASSRPDG